MQSRIRQEAAEAHRTGGHGPAGGRGGPGGRGAAPAPDWAISCGRPAAPRSCRRPSNGCGQRGEEPLAFVDVVQVAEDEDLPAVERLLGAWIQTVALGPGGLAATAGGPGPALGSAPAAPARRAPRRTPRRTACRWPAACAGNRAGRGPWRACWRGPSCAPTPCCRGLGAAHPDLAFVSPRLVKLPYGPVQVGVAAPAASPFKLRAEQEAARGAPGNASWSGWRPWRRR